MRARSWRTALASTAAPLSLTALLSISAAMLPSVALAEDEQSATEQQTQVVSVIADTTRGSDQIETTVPEIDSTATSETQEQAPTVEESADSMDTEATGEQTTTAAEDSGETKGSNQSAANSSESIPATEAPKPLPESQPAKAPTNVETPADDSDSQDEPLTGEQYIDGHWYYYDESGKPVTGWHTWADGTRSYFGTDGAALSGLQVIDGKTYYFDPDNGCHSARGKQTIDGKRYLFDEDSSAMAVKWHKWSDGSWSYSNPNGVAYTGWLSLNKKWYYLDPATLRAIEDGGAKVGGKWYAFDGSCAMVTGWRRWAGDTWSWHDAGGAAVAGWKKINGKWYFLDPNAGVNGDLPLAVPNVEKSIGGKTYSFDKSCAMVIGWRKWSDGWTYAGTDGAEKSGWQYINKKWYYMVPETLRAATGQYTVKGKLYYFEPSCAMISGWHKWSDGWSWSGTDGAVRSGWQYIKGAWYYLKPDTLRAVTGEQTIDDKKYYFYGSCAMAKGAVSHDGVVRLYGSDGALITKDGFSKANGYWYYLKDMTPVRGDQTIGGKQYYFDSSYRMCIGWVNKSGKWYYYDNSGVLASAKTGTFYCTNGKYYFYTTNRQLLEFNWSTYNTWQKIKNMTSKTQYLFSVDHDHFFAHVFRRVSGIWEPLKTWRCTVGKPETPTPKGVSEVGRRGDYAWDKKNGNLEYYVIEIRPGWQCNIHSILYRGKSGRVMDGRLGVRVSGGCIRLATENAKWAFYNLGRGTKVYIY